MSEQASQASRDARAAVHGIATELLAEKQSLPAKLFRQPPLELAAGIRKLQHATFVYYLRNEASTDALYVIRTAIDDALRMLVGEDEQLAAELTFAEPFRHRLYANATSIAICAFVRKMTRREVELARASREPRVMMVVE